MPRAPMPGAPTPGAPIHIHVAEQIGEVQACLDSLGARPVQWLLDNFPVDRRWCLVHATHMDGAEIPALAASGAAAGLCPTTEANLGDGIFPAAPYLEAGGIFGIGSDSHIAVDWRSELRLLEYGQRLLRHERNVLAGSGQPWVADRLFDAAAAGGAQAGGRATGWLAPGRRADFMVLDANHPALAGRPPQAWLSGVVFGETGGTPIRDVYVGGVQRVAEGRHADEERARADYLCALNELLG
ncbi:amidohydrolase family protein [Candidimonas humi]|nr:amidohydrolase family protein [Candidimonas humi]